MKNGIRNTEYGIRNKEGGFTIVELSIATLIFATVLMLCVYGLLQISRLLYRGISSAKTQAAARAVIDEIARPLQFGGTVPQLSPAASPNSWGAPTAIDVRSFCIGDSRYSYVIDAQVNDSAANGTYDSGNHRIRHGLWRDNTDDWTCRPLDLTRADPWSSTRSGTTSTNGEELLGHGMRLANLTVTQQPGTNLFDIDVWVVYGDDAVLNPARNQCLSIRSGAQFCAVAHLTTTVMRRVR